MEISKHTAICAARHIVAAHESACTNKPVDWAQICVGCSEFSKCRPRLAAFGWLDVMGPIFTEAGIHPRIHRPEVLNDD